MAFSELLREIGLTEGEIKVYVALSKKRSKASELVKETGIYRANIYEILDRLIEKGLVSNFIENNVKLFEITDPNSIHKYIDTKKSEIEHQEKIADKIIPLISSLKPKEDVSINVYRCKKWLIFVHEDMLKLTPKGGFIQIFGAEMRSPDHLGKYYKIHHKKRIVKKILHKLIASEVMRNFFESRKNTLTDARYIPKKYVSGVNTYIYQNKVALVIWEKELCIVIENEDIVESYKNYFEILWKQAKP